KEHLMPNGNRISVRCFHHSRFFYYSSQGYNADLRLYNYGSPHDVAKGTYIGYGKCTTAQIISCKPVVPAFPYYLVDLFCQASQAQVVGIFDHWNDKIAIR